MALTRFGLNGSLNKVLCAASTGVHFQSRNAWGNVNKAVPRHSHRPNKHRPERWKKLRGFKILRIDLPDYHKKTIDQLSPEEMRAQMKKMGVLQPRTPLQEAPLFISATGAVFDAYNPPEEDAAVKILTKDGAKDQVGKLTSKGKSFRATRKIRTYDDDFDPKAFGPEVAQQIYIDAHKSLSMKDEKKLHELVTEKVFPEMMYQAKNKSIYWDFVKSLEPPRTVSVRADDVITKGNVFAQVIVRFHTQQVLAVYDRFGRLIHGHPHVAKDVLEYVVFEKHLANLYGKWRLHAKIVPEWLNARKVGGYLGYVVEPEPEVEEDSIDTVASEDSSTEESEEESTEKSTEEEDKEKESSVYDRFGRLIKKYKN